MEVKPYMSEWTDALRDACNRFELEQMSLSSVERFVAEVRGIAGQIDQYSNVVPLRVHDTHSVKVEAHR